MKKPIFALLFSAMILGSAAAVAAPETIAAAPAAAVAITLDGNLNEAAWQQAEWSKNFSLPASGAAPKQNTRFKVLAAAKGLYFGFNVTDRSVLANAHEHDFALWSEDCIEIFLIPEKTLSPDRNIREYCHFIFNPAGMRYDAKNLGGVSDTNWNPPWQVVCRTTQTGYDAEVFIPYYCLPLKAGETAWRLNVGREDRHAAGPGQELSIWSPSDSFADADRFGNLTRITCDFARYDVAVTTLAPEVIPGVGQAQVVVAARLRAAPGRALRVKLAARRNGKLAAFTGAETVIPSSGVQALALPLNLSNGGAYEFELIVLDGATTIARETRRTQLNIAPLALTLIAPCYRDNLYRGNGENELKFTISLKKSAPGQLRVTVTDAAAQTVAAFDRPTPAPLESFTIDTAPFPPGRYTLTATLDGAAIQTPFRIVPAPRPRGNTVTLDAEHRVRINGQLFFPRGFIGGNDAVMPLLRQSGFNIMQVYTLHLQEIDTIIAWLDRAEKYGLKLAFSPFHRQNAGFWGFKSSGKTTPVLPPGAQEKLIAMVNAVKTHPAFFGWYLYDEPRGAEFCAELRRAYELLREIDPDHPVLGLDNSADGCINKKAHCDIHILDMYPSPTKSDRFGIPISTVCNAAQAVSDGTGKEGFWYCPQAFDRESFEKSAGRHRAPSFVETRCAVYGAIAAGATGILPYKIGNPERSRYFVRYSNSGIFASPEMKLGWLEGLGPELAALAPVLTAPGFKPGATPATLRTIGKTLDAENFIIAVNPESEPLVAQIRWPAKAAKAIRVLSENRTLTLKNGTLTDSFAPFAVHIYTDAPRFPAPIDLNALAARIRAETEAAQPR